MLHEGQWQQVIISELLAGAGITDQKNELMDEG